MTSEAGASSSAGRDRQVLRIIWLEGSANVLVLILKLVVGLATGSFAVLSDSLHSLSDVANNVVAWFVIRLSARPADRDHPYGHHKFETLAVFCLASLLTVLAIQVALGSLRRESGPIAHEGWELAVMGVVLVVNVLVATWENRWAQRLDSDLLKADAGHTLADVLATLVVIAGWQLSARGHVWLDTLCTLGVSVLVLTLAYGLFRRAIPVLVDHAAIDPEAIAQAVASLDGVAGVRDVRSRGSGRAAAVDLVVEVAPQLPTRDAHAISDRVEAVLKERFEVLDATVHIEPAARQQPSSAEPAP